MVSIVYLPADVSVHLSVISTYLSAFASVEGGMARSARTSRDTDQSPAIQDRLSARKALERILRSRAACHSSIQLRESLTAQGDYLNGSWLAPVPGG